MPGHTKFSDLSHKASPEKLGQARRVLHRELTLAELRKAREMTQTQLAAALETTQPGVSQIERRTDLYLSTLRSYVEALGGELEVIATFPGSEPIEILTFVATDESGRELAEA